MVVWAAGSSGRWLSGDRLPLEAGVLLGNFAVCHKSAVVVGMGLTVNGAALLTGRHVFTMAARKW